MCEDVGAPRKRVTERENPSPVPCEFTAFSHGGRTEDHGEHGVGGAPRPRGHLRLRVHRGPPFCLRAKKGCCQRHRRPTRWAGWRRSNRLQYKWAACTETCSTRAHGPLDRVGPRLQRERRRTGAARTRRHRRTALQRLGADVQPRASLRNGTGRAGMRAGRERGTVCGARPTFRSKQRHRAARPDRRSRPRLHAARRAGPPAGTSRASRWPSCCPKSLPGTTACSPRSPATRSRTRVSRSPAPTSPPCCAPPNPQASTPFCSTPTTAPIRSCWPATPALYQPDNPAADPSRAPPVGRPCRLVRRPFPALRAHPARHRLPLARPRHPGTRRPGRSAAHDLPGLEPRT